MENFAGTVENYEKMSTIMKKVFIIYERLCLFDLKGL